MKLFLACAPGLEAAVAEEAAALGMKAEAAEGGAAAEGDVVLANRWLRCVSRVWVEIAKASRPDDLARISLDSFRPKGAPICLDCPPRWESAAMRAWGKRAKNGLEVLVQDDGTVSVDSSGELLHVRGYREELGKAPLRETLGAAVLRYGGYTGDGPLWDVMCGSGTLLIEGAWMALGIAPGSMRHFAWEYWPRKPELKADPAWPRGTGPFFGSDLNSGQLGITRRNAKRAGVQDQLILARMDATKLTARPGAASLVAGSPALPDAAMAKPGLVVANLPYGIRVGEKSELGALYAGVGASLKKVVPGWRFAFLLQEGAETLGLPIEKTHAVNNGGIRCQVVVGRVPAA